ncbi:alpha-1,2-mannosyltransferase [Ephemerocybe angulata]|uniref:Alpha-1,2-mannosyltransferase n=1 Tax=Ephemerocybe angulata TaxID=980116 RepID=A0A8H6M0S3_9AGAR|nr:alpha-1,2-mannosyltransferase [Tulosesus angulatus]
MIMALLTSSSLPRGLKVLAAFAGALLCIGYLSIFFPNRFEREWKTVHTPQAAAESQGFTPYHQLPNYGLAPGRRANATFVILARNSDLAGTVQSIRDMEDRFNRHYQYPYVFLNDEPFDDKFKEHISMLTDAKVEFGVIPKEHWQQPDWVDEPTAEAWRDWLVGEGIIYGESVAYRNMCRFNSGFFFHHPLLQKYRWYWRIEPDVRFHCDLHEDPFVFMEDNNKTYGFTISLIEFPETIRTLWDTVREFTALYPEYVPYDNSLDFVSDDGGETFNMCHFWSNFEIADMDFWRGPAYTAFFQYLEVKGGFYYERWGDAPVHSIAAALFLPKDQIHFFDEIGYEHPPFTHCPKSGNNWKKGRCTCDPENNFDFNEGSCLDRWSMFMNGSIYAPPTLEQAPDAEVEAAVGAEVKEKAKENPVPVPLD